MNRFSSRTLYRAIAAPRAALPTGRVAPLHTSRHLQSTGGYGNNTVSGQTTSSSGTSGTSSSPKSSEDASAQSGGSRSKEAVETGSSPTAGKIPNAPEGKKSNKSSTSDSDKFAIPDALASGDARGRTGGGEPLSSSHQSAPAQPKISNASVAGDKPKLTKEQQAEVDEHNRDFEKKHGKAEKAEDDKVNPKFWGGGGRRMEED